MIKELTYPIEYTNHVQHKIAAIYTAVHEVRTSMGIQPSDLNYGFVAEGSCFGSGEMENLLGQLVHTQEGYGEWGIITPDPSNIVIIESLYNRLLGMGLRK